MNIIIFLIALFSIPIIIEIVVILHDIIVGDDDKYWGGLQ